MTATPELKFKEYPQYNIVLEAASKDYYATNLIYTGTAVWQSGENLCNYCKENIAFFNNKSILELGSGVGIVGIALATMLAREASMESHSRFVITDGYSHIVDLMLRNCELNKVNIDCKTLRWNNSDDMQEMSDMYSGGFQCIFGSDLYYNRSQDQVIHDIFATVAALLSHDGIFLMACTRRDMDIETVFSIASGAGFQWGLAEDSVYDIFGNNTEGMTELWRDAIFKFRRKKIDRTTSFDGPGRTIWSSSVVVEIPVEFTCM